MRDFSNGIAQPNHEGGGCISFHNVSYTVEQRTCLKKRPPKVILNDVRSVEPVAAQYTYMCGPETVASYNVIAL